MVNGVTGEIAMVRLHTLENQFLLYCARLHLDDATKRLAFQQLAEEKPRLALSLADSH